MGKHGKKNWTIPDSNTNKGLRSVTEHKLETDLIIFIFQDYYMKCT